MVEGIVNFLEYHLPDDPANDRLTYAYGALVREDYGSIVPMLFDEDPLHPKIVAFTSEALGDWTLFASSHQETIEAIARVMPWENYIRAFCSIIRIGASDHTLYLPEDHANKATTWGMIDLVRGPIRRNPERDGYVAVVADNLAPTAVISKEFIQYTGRLSDLELHQVLTKIV